MKVFPLLAWNQSLAGGRQYVYLARRHRRRERKKEGKGAVTPRVSIATKQRKIGRSVSEVLSRGHNDAAHGHGEQA